MGTCRQCNRADLMSGHLTLYGYFCSTKCAAAFAEGRSRFHAEALTEALTALPDELAVEDFERFGLRIAAHIIEGDKLQNALPLSMRNPDILALRVKELVVQELPDEYVRIKRNPGLLGPDYWYNFTRPIPRRVVLDAAERAGMLDPGGLMDRG